MSPVSTSLSSAKTATMQAIRFYAPGDIRLETISVPQPGPGELLIKVDVALTDGTDLKAYRRGHPVLLGNVYPAPFGHECVGTVVALGDGADPDWLDKRVVPANSAPCGECYSCQKQALSQCEALKLLNGAYAQYLVLPERIVRENTYPVPLSLDPLQVAFAEPLAVCLKGIEETGVSKGVAVAVLGTGPVATILALLAKRAGVDVTMIGRDAEKLALAAERSGVLKTLLLSQLAGNQLEAVIATTPSKRGFDAVIEATGQPECWEMALEWVRPAGTLQLFGGCPRGSTVQFSTARLHYDEIRVLSSFHHTPKQFKTAVEWLIAGDVDLRFLMTHQFPLAQTRAAFTLMDAGQAQKVAILPWG